MSKINIQNLTVTFKDVVALEDVNLTFQENKIYGLLGRNGAGKSTLLNAITNKIFPTSGDILVDGEKVLENEKALSKIYCMSEQTFYPDNMKIKDVFKWSKEFYPDFDHEYAIELTKKFDLKINKAIKSLSTGYNSIFKIIVALSCNAPVILLDEPVLGLDANHRDLFYKELINSYSENPRTIIISTHLIEEIADLIEEVVIIKQGKILINESAEKVKLMGYGVSGKASDVDEFIKDKEVLSVDVLGGLKTAYLLGEKPREISSLLDVSTLDLQKLFIKLTNV